MVAVSLGPVQYPLRTQRVPPARLSLVFDHLDRHYARIPDLQRPSPIVVAFRFDQVNSVGHSFFVRGAGTAQVLKSPQHVVVPPRRERKTGPIGAALAISRDHLTARAAAEE